MAKHPGGRPTKYKPEYCEQLIAHMAQGYSFETFGCDVQASKETLYAWCDKHPEFLDAKKRGEVASQKWHETMGAALIGGTLKGSAAAWIFTMKNKHSWTDKHEITGKEDKPLILKYALDEVPNEVKPQTSANKKGTGEE